MLVFKFPIMIFIFTYFIFHVRHKLNVTYVTKLDGIMCVCVCISFHRKGFSWLKQNKCNVRDQASDVVPRKLLSVKYLCRHVIGNHSRYFKASNSARVSVKPGRAMRSKRTLQLPSSSLTSGAVLPQHKSRQSLSGLPTYRWTVAIPRGVL